MPINSEAIQLKDFLTAVIPQSNDAIKEKLSQVEDFATKPVVLEMLDDLARQAAEISNSCIGEI
jgi:hypothetical protein